MRRDRQEPDEAAPAEYEHRQRNENKKSASRSANDASDEGRLSGFKNEKRTAEEPHEPQPSWCVCNTAW